MSVPSRECALEIVKNSFHSSDIKPSEPSDYLKDLVQLLLTSETGKSQLKSMQQYIKTHNIFVDLHNMPEIQSLKNLGVVASFNFPAVDTFSVKFYFCPLPEDPPKYYYHYYELVTRGDIKPNKKMSPEKKPDDFKYVCNRIWKSNMLPSSTHALSIYESYPDVFDSLCEEYYNPELRFLPAGSGTSACQKEQEFILQNNIAILRDDYGSCNDITVVGLIPRDEFLGLELDSLEHKTLFEGKTFQIPSNLSEEYSKWLLAQQHGFKFSDFLYTLVI
jgi:hypothetical protein